MKKYNLSKIMKRAWELVKKTSFGISEALKKAWKEAKNDRNRETDQLRKRSDQKNERAV